MTNSVIQMSIKMLLFLLVHFMFLHLMPLVSAVDICVDKNNSTYLNCTEGCCYEYYSDNNYNVSCCPFPVEIIKAIVIICVGYTSMALFMILIAVRPRFCCECIAACRKSISVCRKKKLAGRKKRYRLKILDHNVVTSQAGIYHLNPLASTYKWTLNTDVLPPGSSLTSDSISPPNDYPLVSTQHGTLKTKILPLGISSSNSTATNTRHGDCIQQPPPCYDTLPPSYSSLPPPPYPAE